MTGPPLPGAMRRDMPRNRHRKPLDGLRRLAGGSFGSGRRPTALYARRKPATGEGADSRPADVQPDAFRKSSAMNRPNAVEASPEVMQKAKTFVFASPPPRGSFSKIRICG
jgi:hypothetical protein